MLSRYGQPAAKGGKPGYGGVAGGTPLPDLLAAQSAFASEDWLTACRAGQRALLDPALTPTVQRATGLLVATAAANAGLDSDAEAAWRQVLVPQPADAQALLPLVAWLYRRHRFDAVQTDLAPLLNAPTLSAADCAVIGDFFAAEGQPELALASYEVGLSRDPQQVVCMAGAALQLAALGEAAAAEDSHRTLAASITIRQSAAAADQTVLNVLTLKLFPPATDAALSAALALLAPVASKDPEAALAAALLERRMGEQQLARLRLERLLAFAPNQAEALLEHGLVCLALREPAVALQSFTKAIGTAPTNARYLSIAVAALRGFAQSQTTTQLQSTAALPTSERWLIRALALDPLSPGLHNEQGMTYLQAGDALAAKQAWTEAIALQPGYVPALANLAQLEHNQPEHLRNPALARSLLQQADEAEPHSPVPALKLAHALQQEGNGAAMAEALARARQRFPQQFVVALAEAVASPVILPASVDPQAVHAQLLKNVLALPGTLTLSDPFSVPLPPCFVSAYLGANERPLLQAVAQRSLAALPALAYCAPHLAQPRRPGPLRIGVASQHFSTHVVMNVLGGLIKALLRADPALIDCTLIHLPAARRDALTLELEALATRVVQLPAHLATAQRALGGLTLDLLLFTDLGLEHTSRALALGRYAPAQGSTWGHPVTSGLPGNTFYLSSGLAEPAGAAEHYSEQLVAPATALPLYVARPALLPASNRAALGLPLTGALYAYPHSLYKFHPGIDQVFVALLSDPTAHLVILDPGSAVREQLLARLSVPADVASRIHFMARRPRAEFMQWLAVCDCVIDAAPFGAGDTAYSAFAVAAPIVTWPGEFLRGRITAALYQRMGITQLVVDSLPALITVAQRLARDPLFNQQQRQLIIERSERIFAVESDAVAFVANLVQLAQTAIDNAEKTNQAGL